MKSLFACSLLPPSNGELHVNLSFATQVVFFDGEEEEEEISPRERSATEDLRHMYFSNSAELKFVRDLH